MMLFDSSLKQLLSGVALTCALTSSAMAQEAEQPAPEQAQDGAATQEQVFDMGEPVDENGNPIPQEPQVGQQYLSELHGDWAIRCLKTEDGNDPCQMYQLLNDGDGNSVAEVAIVALPGGGDAVAGATIVVPLETLLTEQLTLRVDGGQARRVPYNFCNPGGCVTRMGLGQADVNLFRRGAEATLRMVPAGAPDQEVIVTMSLAGFTAAYDAVSAQ